MGAKIAPKTIKKEGEKPARKCEKKTSLWGPNYAAAMKELEGPAAEAGTLGLEFEEILS